MSLGFDYISMPPKSQEISQLQTSDMTRQNQAQQEIAATVQQEVKQQSEQTVRRADTENDPDRYDRESRGKQSGNKKGNKKKKDKEENKNPQSGHNFDLFI